MYYLLFCFVVAFVFWIHDQLVFRNLFSSQRERERERERGRIVRYLREV